MLHRQYVSRLGIYRFLLSRVRTRGARTAHHIVAPLLLLYGVMTRPLCLSSSSYA